MKRQDLEALSRGDLIAKARALGVARPEVLTKPELVDAVAERQPEPAPAKKRGILGKLRDMLATMVERGLDLPQTADRIRNPAPPPLAAPAPLATVTLAEIYAAQGHVERALAVLDEVLAREPDHAAASDLRRRLLSSPKPAPSPEVDLEGDPDERLFPQGNTATIASLRGLSGGVAEEPAAETGSKGAPAPIATEAAGGSAPGSAAPSSTSASSPPPPPPMLDEEPLPQSYDVDEIVVMPVTPSTVYVYWEVRAATIARCRANAAQGRLSILVEATGEPGGSVHAREIDPHALVGDYFLHEMPQGASVQATLRFVASESSIDILARSQRMLSPRALPFPETASEVVSWRPDGPRPTEAPPGIALAVALSDLAAGIYPVGAPQLTQPEAPPTQESADALPSPEPVEPGAAPEEIAPVAAGVEGPSELASMPEAPASAATERAARRLRRVLGGSSEEWAEEWIDEEGAPPGGHEGGGAIGAPGGPGAVGADGGPLGGSEQRLAPLGGSERRLAPLGGSERRLAPLGGSEQRLGQRPPRR